MPDSETVLITGGTGFIGGHTAEQLLDGGYDVVSFDLRTSSPILDSLGIAEDVRTIRGDITDTTGLFRAIEDTGATRIVHLAALLTERTRANPRKAIDVNVRATNTVFEAARTFSDRIDRVVWASSSAVYAPPEMYDGRQLTESDLYAPTTLYGAAKAYNETQAEVYREDYGVSSVGLRPTLVYGPLRETGSATAYADVITGPASGSAVTVGPGGTVLDWQHVSDAAQAFRKAILAPDTALDQHVYNVCGVQATLEEVADIVRDEIPGAEITVTDEGEIPWTHTMDDAAAQSDFGYDPSYDLRSGIRSYR